MHYDESGHGSKGPNSPKVNDVQDDAPDNDKDGALTRPSEDSLAAFLPSRRREIESDPQMQRSHIRNDGQSNLKMRGGPSSGPHYNWYVVFFLRSKGVIDFLT